jgi:hypothetical protein
VSFFSSNYSIATEKEKRLEGSQRLKVKATSDVFILWEEEVKSRA